MTVGAPDRTRFPVFVRIAGALVALVTVAGTFRPWETVFSPDDGITGHPTWTSGATPAIGAAVATIGAVLLAAGLVLDRARRSAALAMSGAALVVAGVTTLLVDRYAPTPTVAAVTVAVGRYSIGPSHRFLDAVPDAQAWLTAGALGAVAVALAASVTAVRPDRRTRPIVAAAIVGAAMIITGASALPWQLGPQLQGESLWRAGGEGAVGAALLTLAAAALLVSAYRPTTGSALVAALLVATGLGLLLADRLPNPWADRTFGWYAYQPLQTVTPPAAWQFHTATTLELTGAVLIFVAAAVASRRTASSARADPAVV